MNTTTASLNVKFLPLFSEKVYSTHPKDAPAHDDPSNRPASHFYCHPDSQDPIKSFDACKERVSERPESPREQQHHDVFERSAYTIKKKLIKNENSSQDWMITISMMFFMKKIMQPKSIKRRDSNVEGV